MVVTTCPTILTTCPELDGATISKYPEVGDTYTGFPLSSVLVPDLLSINVELTLTYPSNANGLTWSFPVEADKHTANNPVAFAAESASVYAILVVSA